MPARGRGTGADDANRTRARRLQHLPGLDALRAFSVSAVVLYHAGVPWLPGGFVGVDVFFVISGFLISLLLLGEVEQRGRVDLRAFWTRRARRLLPALVALLAGVLLWMVATARGELAGVRGDAVAAVAYVTNWFQIVTGQSYFEQLGRPSPFRHLWSLAVEEQYYVLWPLLFGGLLVCRVGRRPLVGGLVAAALASTAAMAAQFHPGSDPSRVYFGTDTRAAPLLIGAVLALAWGPLVLDGGAQRRCVRGGMVGAASLAGLVVIMLTTADRAPWLYRGGFLVVAVLAAGLVVGVTGSARVASVAAWPPLRWIGERSYAIYLWHWPVVVFSRPGRDVSLDGWRLVALRLTLTLVLAQLSWRFVEQPVRDGALARWWWAVRRADWGPERRRATRLFGAGVTATVALAGTVVAVPGVEDPIVASLRAGQAALARAAEQQPGDAIPLLIDAPLATLAAPAGTSTVAAGNTTTQPATTTPAPTPPPPTATATTTTTILAPEVLPAPRLRPSTPETAPSTTRPTTSAAPPSLAVSPEAVGPEAVGPDTTVAPPVASDGGSESAVDLAPTTVPPTTAPPTTVPPTTTPPTTTPPTTTIPSTTTPPTTTTVAGATASNERPAYHYAIPSSAVGDSVMLGSAVALQRTFGRTLFVDAKVGRQFNDGLRRVAALRAARRLGDVLIVHLGNNGPFGGPQLDNLLALVRDVPAVFLVTVHVPFAFRSSLNTLLQERAKHWPNVTVIDWDAVAKSTPGLLGKDGVHMTGRGSLTYAQLLASAIIGACVGSHPNSPGAPPLRLDRCTARVPAAA